MLEPWMLEEMRPLEEEMTEETEKKIIEAADAFNRWLWGNGQEIGKNCRVTIYWEPYEQAEACVSANFGQYETYAEAYEQVFKAMYEDQNITGAKMEHSVGTEYVGREDVLYAVA